MIGGSVSLTGYRQLELDGEYYRIIRYDIGTENK